MPNSADAARDRSVRVNSQTEDSDDAVQKTARSTAHGGDSDADDFADHVTLRAGDAGTKGTGSAG